MSDTFSYQDALVNFPVLPALPSSMEVENIPVEVLFSENHPTPVVSVPLKGSLKVLAYDNSEITLKVWYESVSLGCGCCGEPDHSFDECPLNNIQPRKLKLIVADNSDDVVLIQQTKLKLHGNLVGRTVTSKAPAGITFVRSNVLNPLQPLNMAPTVTGNSVVHPPLEGVMQPGPLPVVSSLAPVMAYDMFPSMDPNAFPDPVMAMHAREQMAYALSAMNIPCPKTIMIPPYVCASPLGPVGLGIGHGPNPLIPQLAFMGTTGIDMGTESAHSQLRRQLIDVQIKAAEESSSDSPKRKEVDVMNDKSVAASTSSKKPKRTRGKKNQPVND